LSRPLQPGAKAARRDRTAGVERAEFRVSAGPRSRDRSVRHAIRSKFHRARNRRGADCGGNWQRGIVSGDKTALASEIFSPETMLPAVGQGALASSAADDDETLSRC